MELITEITATHDGDFGEHLNMHRKQTFRGKEHTSFVHYYGRGPRKKSKTKDDSADRLHGVMHYHGYDEGNHEADKLHFHREDHKGAHRVTGHLNKKGEVASITHHERFKGVNESKINEAKVFGKTLRSIVPKKTKADTSDDSGLHSPSAPGEQASQKKLLGLNQILKVPDANGNPEGFATSKSPGKKAYGPDAGKKEAAHHVKEGIEQFLDEEEVESIDELSTDTLKSYYKKAGKSAEKHYDKADREEDKAMSTDGNKYPEKQARHNAAAQGHIRNYRNRVQGAARAHSRLNKGK
jgi:hypothetical protein